MRLNPLVFENFCLLLHMIKINNFKIIIEIRT